MNTCFELHLSEQAMENYAMGKVSNADCTPIEEHLLVCPICQLRLESLDEYIRIIKAALTSPPPSPLERIPPQHASHFRHAC